MDVVPKRHVGHGTRCRDQSVVANHGHAKTTAGGSHHVQVIARLQGADDRLVNAEGRAGDSCQVTGTSRQRQPAPQYPRSRPTRIGRQASVVDAKGGGRSDEALVSVVISDASVERRRWPITRAIGCAVRYDDDVAKRAGWADRHGGDCRPSTWQSYDPDRVPSSDQPGWARSRSLDDADRRYAKAREVSV